MPYCNGCGSHVTKDYVRVFSRDGTLDKCINCSSFKEVTQE